MSSFLTDAQERLTKGGLREAYLLQHDVAIQDLWQQRQAIMLKMNQEILQAVAQIEQSYAAEINQLEQEYAMYMHLISPDAKGN